MTKYHVFYNFNGKERQYTVTAAQHEIAVLGNGYHKHLVLQDSMGQEVAAFTGFHAFVRVDAKTQETVKDLSVLQGQGQ
jgi:hypothetical protein